MLAKDFFIQIISVIHRTINSTFSTVIDNILAIGLLFEYINHEGAVLGIPVLPDRRLEIERALLRSSYGRRNGIALHIGLGRTQNMVESIVRLLVFNIILNQHASDLVITGLPTFILLFKLIPSEHQ